MALPLLMFQVLVTLVFDEELRVTPPAPMVSDCPAAWVRLAAPPGAEKVSERAA